MRPKRRRDQVLHLFGGDHSKVMPVDDIFAGLIALRWLGNEDKHRHVLTMTLSNMVRKTQDLVRPRPGHYQLAPKDKET